MSTNSTVRHSFAPGSPLSVGAKKRLEALAVMPDEDIDYSDIPQLSEDFWQNAIRNPFYKPIKKQLTVRLDADLIAWLRGAGKGYQTRINDILRQEMLRERLVLLETEPERKTKSAARKVSVQATVSQRSTTAAKMLR